jgi:hypothetical protein
MIMNKVMNVFFLSCLKASQLMEKKLHFRLNGIEKLQLRMHTMMCDACPRYEKQTGFIEKGIAKNRDIKISEEELEHLKALIFKKFENKDNDE